MNIPVQYNDEKASNIAVTIYVLDTFDDESNVDWMRES